MKQFVCVCVLVLAALPAFAQTPEEREKGWLDVSFGIAVAAEDSLEASYAEPLYGEFAAYVTDYTFPRGASFDFGGGYMFTDVVGLGVNFQGTAHEDTAVVGIAIPHPTRANRHAADAAETPALMRIESAANIQAMIKVPIKNDRVRLRFFGGPTFFRLKADAVQDVNYEHTYGLFTNFNEVDIRSFDLTEAEGTGVGFHGGADLSFMFTRVFGIGGFARYSKGTVTLDTSSVLVQENEWDVKVGGFQAGGGIRLRFGK